MKPRPKSKSKPKAEKLGRANPNLSPSEISFLMEDDISTMALSEISDSQISDQVKFRIESFKETIKKDLKINYEKFKDKITKLNLKFDSIKSDTKKIECLVADYKSELESELLNLAKEAFEKSFDAERPAATLPWSKINPKALSNKIFSKYSMPSKIRIGQLYNEKAGNSEALILSLPAFLSIPKRKGLFFHLPEGSKSEDLLQSITLRIMCSLAPRVAKLHLIDLETRGRAFAALGALDKNLAPIAPATPQALSTFLKEMEERVATLTRSCLCRHEWLCDYNEANPDEAEPYHLICISGFPNRLEEEHLEIVQRLLHGECAARAGIYFFLSSECGRPYDEDSEVVSEFADMPYIFTDGEKVEIIDSELDTSNDGDYSDLALILDSLPDNTAEIVDFLNASLKAKPKNKKVSLSVDESDAWASTAASGVAIPVGKAGKDELFLRLGNGSVVHHALVGGATGTGKTILLHNIILNASELYSPEDLQMILMDFKEGTEFACYEGLPHMRVLSIASELHFGHSVFEWLVAERMRRASLFKKAGVSNLADYINKTGKKLPRILVLMDEFQRLLADKSVGLQVSMLLDDIVRTGRSFGINLILSTQSLANIHMEASTLDSLGLRICLRLSEQETVRFLGYGNTLPAGFGSQRPGQALYNDAGGRIEGNTEFQVAFVDVSAIPARCEAFREREKERFGRKVVETARVFHGEMPVNPTGRIPAIISGKLQAFIGEPLKIQSEPISVTFEQQDGANLLALGQGMEILNNLSINLAAQFMESPLKPEIFVADSLPLAKERWAELVEKGVQFLAKPVQVNSTLDQLTMEIENRKLDEHAASFPPKVFFIIEPQLNKAFPTGNGMDSSPAALKVNTLLEQGPRVGIHMVLITSRLSRTAKVMAQLDRLNMQHFATRIAFRSDEAEALLGYDASTKNIGEFTGVLSDESTGETTPFQAYDTITL
jgi:S-DNA-T family DNA segregation ATPase FtsK/SpoIIIE